LTGLASRGGLRHRFACHPRRCALAVFLAAGALSCAQTGRATRQAPIVERTPPPPARATRAPTPQTLPPPAVTAEGPPRAPPDPVAAVTAPLAEHPDVEPTAPGAPGSVAPTARSARPPP